MTLAHRPGRTATRDLVEEVLQDRLPVLGVHDLWVELHTGQLAGQAFSKAATGAPSLIAVTEKPVGGADHRITVRHPDRQLPRQARGRARNRGRRLCSVVPPNSEVPVRATSPPSTCAIAWKP